MARRNTPFYPERKEANLQVPHCRVGTWLPSEVHSQLRRMADDRKVSVSRLINKIVVVTLRKYDGRAS